MFSGQWPVRAPSRTEIRTMRFLAVNQRVMHRKEHITPVGNVHFRTLRTLFRPRFFIFQPLPFTPTIKWDRGFSLY